MSRMLAIHEFLRTSQVPIRVVAGPPIGAPVRERVTLVVCVVDGTPVLALVPAPLVVNLERLLSLAGGNEICLAHDDEEAGSRDWEPIFADVRLALSHEIVFAAEAQDEATVIRWADFARCVRPIMGDFAEPPRDRVGAYRLSYCE